MFLFRSNVYFSAFRNSVGEEREIADFSSIEFLLLCGFCSDEISFLFGARCLEYAASFAFGSP